MSIEKESKKKFIDKYYKIFLLKEQTDAFEKLTGTPIFPISAFIFKAQLVEFELKRLIEVLDVEIEVHLDSARTSLKRKLRKPEAFDDKTLGYIINVVCEFEGMVTESFKKKLHELNKLRNQFTHHLFSSEKNINDLVVDSLEGIKLEKEILGEIETIIDKVLGPYQNKVNTK